LRRSALINSCNEIVPHDESLLLVYLTLGHKGKTPKEHFRRDPNEYRRERSQPVANVQAILSQSYGQLARTAGNIGNLTAAESERDGDGFRELGPSIIQQRRRREQIDRGHRQSGRTRHNRGVALGGNRRLRHFG